MTASKDIYFTIIGGKSARELESFISSAKDGDPLAPVTVIGPSVYANLSMRHALGRSGFANVRFIVLPRLSELLGSARLAKQGFRPLTPILETTAVRVVSADAQGVLGRVRHHPATHTSLRSTFRELRYASRGALDRLGSQNDIRREVIRLYWKFREVTSNYYDREHLALAAAETIKSGSIEALTDLGMVVFYQIRDITPAELELIEALRNTGRAAVFLGITGDEEADAPVKGHTSRFSGTNTLLDHPSTPLEESNTHLLIAPDSHQEIRWVIRNIMNQAESGVPFHRMAVLFRKREPYASLIHDELRLAGIPAAGPSPDTYASTAVGRTLQGLLDLALEEDLSRDSVIAWLASCPVSPSLRQGGTYSPSLWDTVSRKAGVIAGVDQWIDRLIRYSSQVKHSAARAVALGEAGDERANQAGMESDAAIHMAEFIRALSRDVKLPDGAAKWADYARWLLGVMDKYIEFETDQPESDVVILQRITDLINELGSMDELDSNPTSAEFLEAVRDVLTGRLGHIGTTGQAVFVAPFGTAGAMSFDTVYLVGMIEGAVPPPMADNPLVPEHERVSAGGASEGLPLQQAKQADERFNFLAALAAAPNRVLTFPTADPSGQRGCYPSRWFLEQASELASSPIYTSTLWSFSDRPWLTIISSMEDGLRTAVIESDADRHDYILRNLLDQKERGQGISDHPLASSGLLQRSIVRTTQRNSSKLTEWDGDLSGIAATSDVFGPTDGSVFSPTRLERWARCPFSYFLGNILKITTVEKPEDILSITPRDRGNLIHSVLEEFFNIVMADGEMPDSNQSWSDEHVELLMEVAEKAFDEAEKSGLTGRRLLWRIEKENIVSSLREFLYQDALFRERYCVSPLTVEAKFGFEDDSWDAVTVDLPDGRTARFRGKIDRVDVDSVGKRILVIDYKTGSTSPYSGMNRDHLDKARRLQLPVYSLAAMKKFGSDYKVQAAYWFVTDGARLTLRPSQFVQLDEISDHFIDVVSSITRDITSGLFPANPGEPGYLSKPQNCANCDFDRLCPSRREVVWDRKKSDSRLAPYLQLIGEEPED